MTHLLGAVTKKDGTVMSNHVKKKNKGSKVKEKKQENVKKKECIKSVESEKWSLKNYGKEFLSGLVKGSGFFLATSHTSREYLLKLHDFFLN